MVSIVSDGTILGRFNRVLPALKDKIMARDGKVVIRPIPEICFDRLVEILMRQNRFTRYKGAVQVLWELFGGNYE